MQTIEIDRVQTEELGLTVGEMADLMIIHEQAKKAQVRTCLALANEIAFYGKTGYLKFEEGTIKPLKRQGWRVEKGVWIDSEGNLWRTFEESSFGAICTGIVGSIFGSVFFVTALSVSSWWGTVIGAGIVLFAGICAGRAVKYAKKIEAIESFEEGQFLVSLRELKQAALRQVAEAKQIISNSPSAEEDVDVALDQRHEPTSKRDRT